MEAFALTVDLPFNGTFALVSRRPFELAGMNREADSCARPLLRPEACVRTCVARDGVIA
jgi:hypothetical protein